MYLSETQQDLVLFGGLKLVSTWTMSYRFMAVQTNPSISTEGRSQSQETNRKTQTQHCIENKVALGSLLSPVFLVRIQDVFRFECFGSKQHIWQFKRKQDDRSISCDTTCKRRYFVVVLTM